MGHFSKLQLERTDRWAVPAFVPLLPSPFGIDTEFLLLPPIKTNGLVRFCVHTYVSLHLIIR